MSWYEDDDDDSKVSAATVAILEKVWIHPSSLDKLFVLLLVGNLDGQEL